MYDTMTTMKKDLQGSPIRDRFKFLRKQNMPRTFFALDLDLCLIEFGERPFVVALIDLKGKNDNITDTEAVMYLQALREWNVPVFIIESETLERFDVYEVVGGVIHKTHSETRVIQREQNLTWDGLSTWERALRERRKQVVDRT